MSLESYAMMGPCPECNTYGIDAVTQSFTCVECGASFDSVSELNTDEATYEPWTIADEKIPDNVDPVDEPVEAKIDMTPRQKAKHNLSQACFVLGLMFCLTIIGIPFGVIFLVLSAWIAPDLEDEDDS